jgi:tetratricopeptide (TPR) repeat protein
MVEKRAECFDEIHALLKEDRLDAALDRLLDVDRGRLEPPFNADKNHAWYLIAEIFFDKRRYGDAVRAFQRSIKAWPGDIDAHVGLANSHSEQHHFEAARDILLKAKTMAPVDMRIIYNLANAYFDLGDTHKAALLYKESERSEDASISRMSKKNLRVLSKRKSALPNSPKPRPGRR